VNLQSNDFELFGVNKQFAQERAGLDARWKELQREAHPDKFAAQGDAAQRVAMQWSVRINEAYQRLKDPLKRAAYLCELAGAPINAHSNTAMPAAFLVQQMEWREELDEAHDDNTLKALRENVEAAQRTLIQECAQRLDVEHDFPAAVQSVRALMFIEKFAHDLDLAFDKLET
jgi:molecular chaperone HscB